MAAARRRSRPPDPGSACREWSARAVQGELPRLLLLLPPTSGEAENWFAEQVIAAARGVARADQGCDLLDVDGGAPDFAAGAVEDFLSSPSLFAGRRALILGRATRALRQAPRLAEALGRAVAGDDVAWMVVHAEGGGGKSVAAAWAKLARRDGVEAVRFRALYGDPPPWRPEPDASEAARFAADEARERGLTLEPGAPGALVAIAGARPAQLVQAIEHLRLLGLERAGEDEVRAVAAHGAEGTAQDFAECVLRGDAAGALRGLRRMQGRGLRSWDGRRLGPRDAFGLLLAALLRECERTARVREEVDRGASVEEAMQAAGGRASRPAVQRMEARLRAADRAQIERVRTALLDAERHVKRRGWRDPLAALELLALQTLRRPVAS